MRCATTNTIADGRCNCSCGASSSNSLLAAVRERRKTKTLSQHVNKRRWRSLHTVLMPINAFSYCSAEGKKHWRVIHQVQWRQRRRYRVTAPYWRYTYCKQSLSQMRKSQTRMDKRTDTRNPLWCILALKCDIWCNNFNDFPDNQLSKFLFVGWSRICIAPSP